MGPTSDFSNALVNAFSTADRCVDHLVPREFSTSTPLAQSLDLVFVTVDPDVLESMLSGHAEFFSNLVVVVCTSAMRSDKDGFFMQRIPDGSVANLVARLLPRSRVVAALQQFTAEHVVLASMGVLESDVPVVSDDIEAADLVEGLIDEIRGFDSVYAGQLRSSAAIEGLAAVVGEASREHGSPVGFRLSKTGIKILNR